MSERIRNMEAKIDELQDKLAKATSESGTHDEHLKKMIEDLKIIREDYLGKLQELSVVQEEYEALSYSLKQFKDALLPEK